LRILVIALSGIGDALLFTPAARVLRSKFPEATIDALVMFKGARQVYERTGLFDHVIHHDFLNRSKLGSLRLTLRMRGEYDVSLSVYPSNRKEYNLIQYLIGAKDRGAVKYLRRDGTEFGFLNNRRIVEDDSLHCVEENVALCEMMFGFKAGEIPDLFFPLSGGELSFADSFAESNKLGEGNLVIGFHPGTATFKNQIKRRWEPEKFASLGRKLAKDLKARVLVFGGPDEAELKSSIVAAAGSPDVMAVDAPGIPETAALIKRCDIFVTNDSSLMHVASAMKRKVVAIIGPTNTNYIHPWHTDYEIASLNLDCSPCFIYSPRPLKCFRHDVKFKCIKELHVDLVFNKIQSLLDRPAGKS
jgi:lipopolysaccharide heptosyltransferase II